MDKIIEAILEALPFANVFTDLGMSEKPAAALATILIATFLYVCMVYVKKGQNHLKNKKNSHRFIPLF